MMWQHKDLHELFKESGLEESDFYSGTTTTSSLNKSRSTSKEKIISSKQQHYSPSSLTTTLARPFSSQVENFIKKFFEKFLGRFGARPLWRAPQKMSFNLSQIF